jgi:hypothetical protein
VGTPQKQQTMHGNQSQDAIGNQSQDKGVPSHKDRSLPGSPVPQPDREPLPSVRTRRRALNQLDGGEDLWALHARRERERHVNARILAIRHQLLVARQHHEDLVLCHEQVVVQDAHIARADHLRRVVVEQNLGFRVQGSGFRVQGSGQMTCGESLRSRMHLRTLTASSFAS